MQMAFEVALTISVLVAVGRLLGAVAHRLGQPRVIGEILAGILIGPSALGRVPFLAELVRIDDASGAVLALLAETAIVLYMFATAIEFNVERLHGRVRPVFVAAAGSIVIPLLTGAALALALRPLSPPGVPAGAFVFFIGLATAVTALPVLVRILDERRLLDTHLGTVALTCAVISDGAAWILLAVALGLVQRETGAPVAAVIMALSAVLVIYFVIRPAATRAVIAARTAPEWAVLAIALAALAAFARAADAIGLHPVLGAFALGVLIPHDSRVATVVLRRTRWLPLLLLPAFFALSGLRTDIGLLGVGGAWLLLLLVLVAATAAKLFGTAVVARLAGFAWNDAMRLGVLMNTRGLMELVILNIGREAGLLTPTLFTMFVCMAVVTTAATGPGLRLLDWATVSRRARADVSDARAAGV